MTGWLYCLAVFLCVVAGGPLWGAQLLRHSLLAREADEAYKEAFQFKFSFHWTNNEPLQVQECRSSERDDALQRLHTQVDVKLQMLQCERGPCLLLLAFQMEACECISRVLMKGYKCLEAARSAPQCDLRVRQSIGRRQQGVPWGILCEVKWDPATKGFSTQRDCVTESTLLFHVFHPKVHMVELTFLI